MSNKGIIPVVVVVLISVMAIGLVGVVWYYEANKEKANSNTNTEVFNTNSVANTNITTNVNSIIIGENTVKLSDNYQLTLESPWQLQSQRIEFIDKQNNRTVRVNPADKVMAQTYNTLADYLAAVSLEFPLSSSGPPHFTEVESNITDINGYSVVQRKFNYADNTMQRIATAVELNDAYALFELFIDIKEDGAAIMTSIFSSLQKTNSDQVNTNTTVVDTTDWQTYTNSEYNFQLQIPGDWFSQESSAETIPTKFIAVLSNQENPADLMHSGLYDQTTDVFITIEVDKGEYVDTIEDYWRGAAITSNKEVKNGAEYLVSYLNASTDLHSILVLKDKQLFILKPKYPSGQIIKESVQNIISQVFSTFQLLDHTTGWLTFGQHECDFYMQYPTNLKLTPSNVIDGKFILQENIQSSPIIIYCVSVSSNDLPTTRWETSPVGDISLDGIQGKKFIYQICDGPGCSSDIVSYVVVRNFKEYTLEFYGDDTIDNIEQKIIDSFTFTE